MLGKLVANMHRQACFLYSVERLLHNVPNDNSGTAMVTFVAAMNWILKAGCGQFVTSSGRHYRSDDNAAECWPRGNYKAFIDAIVKF